MSDNCIFCGAPATQPITLKETFTAQPLLQPGNKACNRCTTYYNDPKYRRKNWYSTNGQDFNQIKDVLQFLQDMPPPPFVLYTTINWKKHGWILSVQNTILNHDKFILICDDQKIYFNRTFFNKLLTDLEPIWQKGVIKKFLTVGYPPAGIIRKYALTREECQLLESYKQHPLWHFIIAFKKRDKQQEESENKDE